MKKEDMPINKCVSLRQLKKYQSGRVSERERIAIEGHLSTCELCQYTASISNIDDQELQEDLPFLKNAITNRLFERRRKKRRLQLSKIAAALLFLVTMGFAVQFFSGNNSSSGDLYSEYYQAYDVPDSLVRSASGNIPLSAPLTEAIATYKNLPYEPSEDQIPTSFDYNPEEAALTQLLKGLIFLEKGQTKEAISFLEKAQSNKTKFSEDATWYLALAHLKEKNNTRSIQYLDQILAIKNGFYYSKAKALKAQL